MVSLIMKVTVAVRSAIEASVVAMIRQGDDRGFWKLLSKEKR